MSSKTKWIIVILVIAMVVLGWLWLDTRNDLDNVLSRLSEDSTDYKAVIAEKCNPLTINDPKKRQECTEALSDFGKTLDEYKSEVRDAEAE